ncbi:hypothetical protein [Allonocardiopsis opalescens]|uniref:Serine/arginine repetitive matrix protein 2 n=1 Tax=Allonocardiopsis opalescens TaxID=1144618 RepID=A0A2T0PX61_9ACTN|nr:hypothetical protein [Allonocardiopsis opalescens]PRX96122.1 hypothetical protein CLV72_108128 [Allonocardiopsis opalescens]
MSHLHPRPGPGDIRPGRRWFWIGGLVIVAGIVIGIAGFVVGLVALVGGPDPVARFSSGEPASFTAEEADTDARVWALYADTEFSGSEIRESCTVNGPDPEAAFVPAPYESTSTVDGETVHLVSAIEIAQPGEYTVECQTDPGAAFLVGQAASGSSFVTGLLGSLASFFLIPLAGIAIGIVIIVVTAVKRGKSRRQAAHGVPPHGPHPGPGPYPPGPR